MKSVRIFKAVSVVLVFLLVVMGINVYAALNPYNEILFVEDVSNYDDEGQNEHHSDILKFETNAHGGSNVGGTYPGAWLEYSSYDFGADGALSVKVYYCVNSGRCAPDSAMEIWIDGRTAASGTKMGTVPLSSTGGTWTTYVYKEVNLDKKITGTHSIYIVLTGTNDPDHPFIANLESFQFSKKTMSTATPAKTTASANTTAKVSATTPKTTAPATTAKVTANTTSKITTAAGGTTNSQSDAPGQEPVGTNVTSEENTEEVVEGTYETVETVEETDTNETLEGTAEENKATENPNNNQTTEPKSTNSGAGNTENTGFPVWATIIIAVAVAGIIGGRIFFFIIKKKKISHNS